MEFDTRSPPLDFLGCLETPFGTPDRVPTFPGPGLLPGNPPPQKASRDSDPQIMSLPFESAPLPGPSRQPGNLQVRPAGRESLSGPFLTGPFPPLVLAILILPLGWSHRTSPSPPPDPLPDASPGASKTLQPLPPPGFPGTDAQLQLNGPEPLGEPSSRETETLPGRPGGGGKRGGLRLRAGAWGRRGASTPEPAPLSYWTPRTSRRTMTSRCT